MWESSVGNTIGCPRAAGGKNDGGKKMREKDLPVVIHLGDTPCVVRLGLLCSKKRPTFHMSCSDEPEGVYKPGTYDTIFDVDVRPEILCL